ncbi:TIM-barrel domain-containing protein [Bifidobacterium phasiani]|uniref:Family 31 glucosidase n=1 Tax=Bifidobacterium phasiani TaxID=2834431 RepID=A0ABS6WAK1_9BIFI|nr:TIM-barrel domain-containing protein [Bifidobacterium phasiani]MBW3083509.1 family 31 glucosidase [Bifidobacterium phasiani]
MNFFRNIDAALIWTGGGEYLRIEPWGTDSVRVRAAMMHEPDGPDYALQPCPMPDGVRVAIAEDGSAAELANGGLIVRACAEHAPNGASGYEEYRCRLSFHKADGTLLFEEVSHGGSLNIRARCYEGHIGGDHRITASFDAPRDEHLYGMGEYQQDVLDLKGSSFELAHRNSQASVPFVVSSAGYGFLWNNPAIGRATFSRNGTRWVAESARQLDYWVTVGGPAAIMAHYADATGHAPDMPEWGLGFWQCKLRYWNQKQVLDVAREFRRRGIPLDLIVIDFFHWPHMGDFRFEEEFWPDPKAMCDELHAMGIKVMVSVWPQISLESEHYVDMRGRNLLVGTDRGEDIGMMFEGPSQFYDATNPEARGYVWDLCRRNYAAAGVDAYWLDEAEPEYGTYDFENHRYWAGPSQQVANIYPVEYNRGFYEGLLAEGRRGDIVNLTRCAWAGSQRYGALVWSGDVGSSFADLRAQITCAIHMGMAGIPWFTTDMGGFHDGDIDAESYRELFLRWAQFSCFLPVMRNHGDRSGLRPDGTMKEQVAAADGSRRAQSGVENEPWSMGEEVERILVKFIRLREAMRPYTRELFASAHSDGQPLVRALFYEFPDDPDVADVADEYMFGPDLLVAPVVEPDASSRSVTLPGDGSVLWADLRDGAVYAGGQDVTVAAPLDSMPVFARDGKDHGLAGLL